MGFVVGPLIGLIFGVWVVLMSIASHFVFGTAQIMDPTASGLIGLCTLVGFFPVGFVLTMVIEV